MRIAHFNRRISGGIVALAFLLAGGVAHGEAPTLAWKLVASHPHSASDFTQGLVWADGRLFESDGQYGASRVAEKALATGKTLKTQAIPDTEFGEGLTLLKGELWQLSWREGVAHVYDLALKPLRAFHYNGEGWGLTSDGRQLILSDGSAHLYFIDPDGFRVVGSVLVHDGDSPVLQLNELEWVDGVVYANVWMTDRVARIDPITGTVIGWLDFAALKTKAGVTPEREHAGAVLNGLAWRADKNRLLVTGKWWPQLFEVQLLPAR